MKFKPGDLVLYNYDLKLPAPPWPGPPDKGVGIVIRTRKIEEAPSYEHYYDYDFGFYDGRPPYAEVWIFVPGYGICGFWESELLLLSAIEKKDE